MKSDDGLLFSIAMTMFTLGFFAYLAWVEDDR